MKTTIRVKIIDEVDTIRIYAPYNPKLNTEYMKYHSIFDRTDKCWVSDYRNRRFIEDALIEEYGTFDTDNEKITSLKCTAIEEIQERGAHIFISGMLVVFWSGEQGNMAYPNKNVVFIEKPPVVTRNWVCIEKGSLFEIRDLPQSIANKIMLNDSINCESIPNLVTRVIENPLEKFETDHLLQELERRKVRNEEI